MKLVITKTYKQFQNYLRETGETPKTARYLDRVEMLQGLPYDNEIVRWGEWWDSPLAHSDELRRYESLQAHYRDKKENHE